MTAQDWTLIIGAITAGLVAVLGAFGALWAKVHEYRNEVNGRMTELLDVTRSSALAAGKLSVAAPDPRVQSDGPGAPPITL